MKRNLLKITALTFAVSVVVSGCGSGSNSTLGEAPVILSKLNADRKKLVEETRNSRDYDGIRSKMQEFKDYEKECFERAAEEGPKAVGNDVDFSGDPYEAFKVKEAKVDEYVKLFNAGYYNIRVKVEAKKDFVVRQNKSECAAGEEALTDAPLHYVALTSDGTPIIFGHLNPFRTNDSGKLEADYQPGQTVKAGELCSEKGGIITFDIYNNDFSKFAELKFLSQEEYDNMRNEFYSGK